MSNLLDDLKAMREKLDAAIEWNFGVVGNDPVCNASLDELRRLESLLKDYNYHEYAEYMNKHY